MGIRLTTKIDKISMKKYYLNMIKEKDQRIAELKQELAELKEKDNYHLRYELAGADETITNLKQQLAEKDIRIEELEGQFAYECECNKQLVELQKQLAEKQNTIDEINKEFVQAVHDWKALCAEKDKEIEDWKQKTQTFLNRVSEQNYEIANNNPTQFAIQELAEVERLLYESHYKEIDNRYYAEYEDIKNLIDSRIQALEELKGEKDVED